MNDDEKTCTRCHESKPRTEFWRNVRAPDGIQHTCKPCSMASTRESRARKAVKLGRKPRSSTAESSVLVLCMQYLDTLDEGQRRRVLSMLNAREGSR